MTVLVRMGPQHRALFVVDGEGRCRSCQAPIYWIQTMGGKRMPVDVPEAAGADTVSHFSTCPERNTWRKPR